jgi:hypothetical protein
MNFDPTFRIATETKISIYTFHNKTEISSRYKVAKCLALSCVPIVPKPNRSSNCVIVVLAENLLDKFEALMLDFFLVKAIQG